MRSPPLPMPRESKYGHLSASRARPTTPCAQSTNVCAKVTLRRSTRMPGLSASGVVALLSVVFVPLAEAQEMAIMAFTTPRNNSAEVCLTYFPAFKELPQGPDAAEMLSLINYVSQSTCDKPYGIDFKDKIVLIRDTGNCTLEKAMQAFKDRRAYAIIVALASKQAEDVLVEETSSPVRDLVLTLAPQRTADYLKKLMVMMQPLPVKLYTSVREMDPNLAAIWLLAVVSVAIGGYWSGNIRHQIHIHDEQLRQWQQRDRHRPSGSPEEKPIPSKPAGLNVIDEDSAMSVSVVMVFSFVIFMGAVLVVLYLYVEYLVYFIHGIFALSSCVAVLGVLEPLVYKLPIGTTRLPANAIPCFHGSLEIRQALILVVAAVVPAVWVYYRHHESSWIIQDMLGVCFSVYILRTVRLPSLKIITLLLTILFFYDIFFVFLTPYVLPSRTDYDASASLFNWTGKGESIMVEVATAGGSKEQMPMVVRVPRFGNSILAACHHDYSLLGFGDILIPGFLIAYLRGFDLIIVDGCFYFPIVVIFYGLGLLTTFVALHVTRLGQPALLYLVPFTMLPTVGLAYFRGELALLWHGMQPQVGNLSGIEIDTSDDQNRSTGGDASAVDSLDPTAPLVQSVPNKPVRLPRTRAAPALHQPIGLG